MKDGNQMLQEEQEELERIYQDAKETVKHLEALYHDLCNVGRPEKASSLASIIGRLERWAKGI